MYSELFNKLCKAIEQLQEGQLIAEDIYLQEEKIINLAQRENNDETKN